MSGTPGNMEPFAVGNRMIGPGNPCFIIAEAGSNHGRDLKRAFNLIAAAAEAGADAVKFQTFSARTLFSEKAPVAGKKKKSGAPQTIWDVLRKLELPREWHPKLRDYCEKKKVIFLSTPFDERAVDELERVGVPAYKIASVDITYVQLLKKVASTRKPILLSTGMADLGDIEDALDVIYGENNRRVALLHCAVNHPPRFEDLNLRAMDTMRDAFNVPVGFSDHTMSITPDVIAAARGACIIEKHFTLSRNLPGPDHPFALEPAELGEMCRAVRFTEQALGSPVKQCTGAERENYRLHRRSLVAAADIPGHAKISRRMLAVKRPGYGIQPSMLNLVVGRKAKRDIAREDVITWDMIE
ncbi:MAG: N-acetylneuraminate synthase family protein [bacterium]